MAQATCEWTHDALAAAIRLPCVVRQEVVFEDNGGVEKGEVWRIAAVPGGTKGAQSFHVLLRHRLLPQPDGLEGVGSIREPLVAGDLSLAERGDDPIVDLDVCAACPAASLLPLMAQDFVAAGVHILDAGAPEAESLDDVPIELPSSLASANRPSVRPVSGRGDLVILGQQGEPGSPIAPVEVVHMSTDDLHVLLRHRLLPQPHGFEGPGSCLGHVGRRDLPPAEAERLEVVEVNGDPAPATDVALFDLDDDVVPQVLGFRPRELNRLPCVEPGRPELLEPIVSAVDPREVGHPEACHVPDNALVDPVEGAIEILPLSLAVKREHSLNVLLRHRLLRQPGGFEGLGLAHVELYV